MSLLDWQDELAAMRTQELIAMRPTDRAIFAVAAAAHRDALTLPWPDAAQAAEAKRLAAEFGWLLEAAVCLQEGA